MIEPGFSLNRRHLLSGLGAAVLMPPSISIAAPPARIALGLQARPGTADLRPGEPETPIWKLSGGPEGALRFKRGDEIEITLANELPVPVVLNWHGIDGGNAAAEPLLARLPVAPKSKDTFLVTLRHAGTFMLDVRLLDDPKALPSQARILIVQETDNIAVDRDEVFLIEDWRLHKDGGALTPGIDTKDASLRYTVNGKQTADLAVRVNERLRFRFINGCQRNVIAIKIENYDVRVMALDGQPSEPFLARNGQLVLAPGTRIDVFIDAVKGAATTSSMTLHDGKAPYTIGTLKTSGDAPIRDAPLPVPAPLPSNGLPAQIDLKSALRVDIGVGSGGADWITPAALTSSATPAFRAKRGRTVVLALTNRSQVPTTFHLHGHHFRLLDRMDDGWKPFWLDTLIIDAGQTQRVAFAAETGRWLMESMAGDWAAPRLVRWFNVE